MTTSNVDVSVYPAEMRNCDDASFVVRHPYPTSRTWLAAGASVWLGGVVVNLILGGG